MSCDQPDPRSQPYQYLSDSISSLGKGFAGAHRQLSELLSLHECVTMLQRAKNLDELLEVFVFTVLGEHPCKSAAVFIRDEYQWEKSFYKGVSQREIDLSKFETIAHLNFAREIIHVHTAQKPMHLFFGESGLMDAGLTRLIPLTSGSHLVGFLALGEPLIADNLIHKKQWLLDVSDLFGLILGSSLDKRTLKKVNQMLEKRLFQLQTIREATDVFIKCVEFESVFRALIQNLMGQFFISRGALLDFNRFELLFSAGCRPTDVEGCLSSSEHCGFLKELRPNCLARIPNSTRFSYALRFDSEEAGMFCLLLGPRLNGKDIEADDENLVLSLSRQAGAALSQIALQEQRLENERMLKELELARSIQQKLLPKQEPDIPGYEITAEMRPFKQVGGDFFDWFPLGDTGNWGFCLADVSGKSLPASMIMTTTQAGLRALSSYSNASALDIVDRLNRQLCVATPSNRFVTMFFGVLDPSKHQMIYINAGHNPPFLFRHGEEIHKLTHGGMVLGMFSSAPYKAGVIDFLPGDELLIYTDGISELMDESEEEYGDDRVARWLETHAGNPSLRQELDALFESAITFSKNRLIDDMTVVMLRRNS